MTRSQAWQVLLFIGLLGGALWLFQEAPDFRGNISEPTERHAEISDKSAKPAASNNGVPNEESSLGESSGKSNVIREGVVLFGIVNLTSPDGASVDGRVVFIHDRKELREGIAIQTDIGESLWENITDFDGETEAGTTSVDKNLLSTNAETLVMVFAPGFAPLIQSLGTNPTFPLSLSLTPVEPITVSVQDPSGNPIAGAVVAARADTIGSFNASKPLVDQLNWLFYQSVLYSDEMGMAELANVLPETNNIIVQPKNGFASVSQDGVASGTALSLTCDFAFRVHGRILDSEGNPIANARAKAYSDLSSDSVFVGSDHADASGNFTIGRIPASQPAIKVHASMQGMETAPWLISHPSAGADYAHDFVLHAAVGGSVTLVTESGAPIAGAEISFARSNVDFVPGYYTTNEKGVALLQVAFRKGYPYSAEVRVGNQDLRVPEPFFASDDSTITVKKIGRILAWEIPEEAARRRTPAYCIWRAKDSSRSGESWWAISEPSPWIPTGLGTFAIQFDNGTRIEKEYTLVDGEDGVVTFSAPSSSITFTIPEGKAADAHLYSKNDAYLASITEATGAVTIPCKPGLVGLNVVLADDTQILMNGILVPPDGLNLGELHLAQDASLTVRVLNAAGNCRPDTFVSVVTVTGILVAEGWTDTNGLAIFDAIPPGPCFVYSNGESAYFIQGREALTSIQLLPGQHQELTLKMGSAEGTIEVAVDRAGLPMPQGFFVGGGHRVNYHLPSNGIATLPASEESGYLGVTANRTGYAMIAALQIPAGPGSYKIERGILQEINLHFVDENGAPQSGLMIGFYLAGQHLPYRPHTDASGNMQLELHSGLPLEMEVWTDAGVPLRFPIAGLTSGQNVVIPTNLPRKNISFRSEEGARILGLQVVGDGFPECIFAKHDGTVDVPILVGRFYYAQASNYFPVLFNPNVVREVTLPRSLSSATFSNAPEGTQFLYVQSHAAFDSPLALEGWLSKTDGGKWQAGDLPVGGATVTAYGNNDQMLGEYQLRLTSERSSYALKK